MTSSSGLRIVLAVIGVIALTTIFLGLMSLIGFGEFFAKIAGLVILGGIFWIVVVPATSRLSRRFH